MQCPRCQLQSREGRHFCAECGAPLGLSCPACSFSNEPGEKFCGGCGRPLAAVARASERFASPQVSIPKHLAAKILTSRGGIEGERKQVTVLFADLKGSMELLADRDAEEARTLLDQVLGCMMGAVHHYEGTVNQVMGDGIMALFGAPVAHEDHAVRACYAALGMQEAVGRYAEELRRNQGVNVQIRVGLNSGEVVVRSIGSDLRMDYTAVGQTTHLAGRMEQLARAGTTLVSGATHRLTEGYFEVNPLGPVPVRGLTELIETYEIIRALPVRSRLQAMAARGLTRFVGRQAELESIRQALRLARAGHGQVVAIVGEAGVGKSRLLLEFVHSGDTQGWRTLESAAVSYTTATPYLPVSDLLKTYFQIEAADDAQNISEKVTRRVLMLDKGLEPTLPAILTLLDVPVEDPAWQALDPSYRRQRTFDAVKRLLLRESQGQPLLLIFENLHWADSETDAFLHSLVESLPTARVVLLVTYRPEYQHGWGSKTYYTQLRLDALLPERAEELLEAILGDDLSLKPLKRLLIDQTEGNPFFLEESVQALVETQMLRGERGAYRLAQDLPSIHVPAVVQAVLAARIDRLLPEEKLLLQAASVIGRHLPFALLREISDLPEQDVRQALTHLRAAEFLYETSLFPEVEYTFKHALTYEVAYGSLLQEQRRTLHARILEQLERLAARRPAEQVDQLAHHAFRGEVWDKALTYLRQAGAKALARSGNREAVAYYQQALVVLGHLAETRRTLEEAVDLRFDLRPPLLQLGRLQEVLALSQEAETIAKRLGDEQRLAHVHTYLSNYYYLKGEPDLAIDYGERCLMTAGARNDLSLQAQARQYMGHSYHAQGRYREAESSLRRSIEMLETGREQGDVAHISYVASSGWLALTLAELGEFDRAEDCLDMAHRAAEASHNAYSQTIARTLAGLVAIRRGHLERAVQSLEQGLEACRDKHLTVWQPVPSSLLGLAFSYLGRVDEGLRLLEEGVAMSDAVGVKAYVAQWTTHLAEGLLATGLTERALAVVHHALDLALAHKERGHRAWALRLLGEIAARRDPPEVENAEASYREAIGLAQELGMRPLLARSHLGLGHLYRRTGNRRAAASYVSTAIAWLHQMDMRFWLEQAAVEVKELGGLFVVPPTSPELYGYLKQKFPGDEPVSVLLDRRRGERRQPGPPHEPERRRSDRRHPPGTNPPLGLVVP